MTRKMTAKEAIVYVAEHHDKKSFYAMAASLSNDEVKVQPTQISNYLAGTKMSEVVARRFEEVYGIEISDVYRPGALNRRRK